MRPGQCEVCDNVNAAGVGICEWCETPIPVIRAARRDSAISSRPTRPIHTPTDSKRRLKKPARPWPALTASTLVLLAFIGIVGIASAKHWKGASNPSTSQNPDPASVAPTFYNLQPGDCVNNLNYASHLNGARLSKVPCDSPAARMQFVGIVSSTEDKSACEMGGERWTTNASTNYCYKYLFHPGICYPGWTNGSENQIQLSIPHECNESIDPAVPLPDLGDGWQRTEIAIEKIISDADHAQCTSANIVLTDQKICLCLRVR
ncbi:LppU/SCO3897 family protein [Nocardia elegans]